MVYTTPNVLGIPSLGVDQMNMLRKAFDAAMIGVVSVLVLASVIVIGTGKVQAQGPVKLPGSWDPMTTICTCPVSYNGCYCLIL